MAAAHHSGDKLGACQLQSHVLKKAANTINQVLLLEPVLRHQTSCLHEQALSALS